VTHQRALAGRVAVVTGVTAGIGRATAARLLAAGASVVGCARDADRLSVVAELLPGLETVRCDVRDAGDRERLVDSALTRYGRIDVLVNNAGLGHVGAVVDLTDDDVDRVVRTNVTGPIDLTRRVLPGMLARGDGDLLMLSSVAAWIAPPPLTAYAATKHAVDGFVEGLRREVTPHGVRVHSVNPWFVATEFHARALGLHPQEGDPRVELSPGIGADGVARVVRQELERGRGRTVAVPRWAGAARAASVPPGSHLTDLVLRGAHDRLVRQGRRLAERRSGG
jgi:NAD(P)-dependent dehydrogenase (short-subunit alcohol dehydrogenase family)